MDPIRKAISDLKTCGIPRAILDKVFISRHVNWRDAAANNLDEQILALVIRPKVLTDCDIVGGTEITVPIGDLPYDKPDSVTTVIRIPKTRTQHRSIVVPLHVSFMPQAMAASYAFNAPAASSSYPNSNFMENNATMGAASGMVAALDKIPIVTSANVRLISENVIAIKDAINFPQLATLRCRIANEENLANIQIPSYIHFAQLVEYAVKAYIYNALVIEIDTAELQGGQALGAFKTIVESYSDAYQNYKDYLREKWTAVAFMNDQESYRRFIKLNVGGYR